MTDQAALDRQVANALNYIKNVSWSRSLAEINSAIMAFSEGDVPPDVEKGAADVAG